MPTPLPVRDAIQVLMPMTEPSSATSEPPELPGLIDASVWMYSAYGLLCCSRPTALMIPEVTDD